VCSCCSTAVWWFLSDRRVEIDKLLSRCWGIRDTIWIVFSPSYLLMYAHGLLDIVSCFLQRFIHCEAMGQNASSTTSRPIQAGDYAFSLYVTIGYWMLAASSFNDIFVAIDSRRHVLEEDVCCTVRECPVKVVHRCTQT
jgi:hypothetical protein